jgi:formylglycine-generating enzyme required for sulfatase activity
VGDNLVFDQNNNNQTSDVGSKPEGASWVGALDMSGNVWEWVQDWYDPAYYPFSPKQNPPGPSNGTLRIVRGGGWLVSDARLLSCSHRHRVPPDTYSYSIGFRVLCQV